VARKGSVSRGKRRRGGERTHADRTAAGDMSSTALNEGEEARVDDAEEGRSEGVAVIVSECNFVSFRSRGRRRKGRNARVAVADFHQNARHLLLDHVLHKRDVLVEALPRDLDNHVEDVAVGAFLQA
jgi:hypothetical protein